MATRFVPALQYAKTGDGVNIAFMTVGDGRPVVFASNIFGDVQHYSHLAWSHVRGVTDALAARGWNVVRYDVRGMGSSDRSVADLSVDARVMDLEAVVDRLRLDRFALGGVDIGAATAIAYAARHASKVSRLVLVSPWISGARMFDLPDLRAAARMLAAEAQEWNVFTNVLASVVNAFDDAEYGRQLAAMMRRAATPEGLAAYYRSTMQIDLAERVQRLTMPTLVVHEPTFPFGSFELCREVAKGISDSRFAVVDDKSIAGTVHDGHVQVMDEFLRSGTAGSRSVTPERSPPTVNGSALTPRELLVLGRVAAGLTNKEIAAELGISAATVERHLVNVYAKIGARRRVDATAYALRHGLVTPRS